MKGIAYKRLVVSSCRPRCLQTGSQTARSPRHPSRRVPLSCTYSCDTTSWKVTNQADITNRNK